METSLTETRIRAMTGTGFWRDESLERGSIISCQLPNWKVVEVQNLLYTHPKIAGVKIVGIPDPRLGERACAVVIPREGQTITRGEIVAFLEQHELARQKLPERLELVAERIAAGGGRGG